MIILFLAFIFPFTGLASANVSFEIGQEYVFKYEGKVLIGLPDIDAHFAGFTITSQVLIQPIDAITYKLALKNVAFAKFHEKLDGPEPKNWRSLLTPTPSPIDPALIQFMEAPIEFTMNKGKISNIQVSSHEPQWTGNIKRAMLDLFKIQQPVHDHNIQQLNMINNSDQNVPDYFEIMEEGINGICENIYTITELPAHLTKDPTSWTTGLLNLETCTNKKVFQIIKVCDVTKCEKLNHYVSRTMMKKQIPARTSVTKFVGCGPSRANIMLHGVIQEGESVHNMDGLNTEPMVTGIKQVLHLQQVRPAKTKMPDIADPRTMTTVVYEFALNSDSVPLQTISSAFAKGTSPPLASWLSFKTPEILNAVPELSTKAIKADIITKLKEIAIDLSQDENIAEKQVTSKLMSIIHVFTTLTNGDILAFHKEIKALPDLDQEVKQIIMDLWLDVATMAGTTHSVLFLKHIIETEDVTAFRSFSTIMTLGHYIRTPTVDHLNYFFNIVKSPVVLKNKMIKHNAIHNFANMINKACIAYEEPKHFPVHAFGEFCSSATSELITTYIPYILEQLNNANDLDDKEAYMIALGTIGHEAIIPLLLPLIEGKVEDLTSPIRIMSILTLNTVVKKHRKVLLPVYSAILDNHLEDRNVRIAALSMILKAEPSLNFMQKIAVSTWYEKDPEMAKFIFSTLKSLSEKEFENMANVGSLEKTAKKARSVLPLVKPIPGMLFYSSNQFVIEYLKYIYVGYEQDTTYTFTPQGNTVFSKLLYILDQIKLPVVELAFNLKGEKTLFEQLQQEFSELMYGSKSSSIVNAVHIEWKKIIQDMKIKARDNVPFHAALCLNLFDDVMAHLGADQSTLDMLMSTIKSTLDPIMKDPRAAIKPICDKKIKFNFHKVFNLLPTEVITSSELGIPIFSEVHAPNLLALNGHIKLTNCDAAFPTIEIALKTKIIGDWYGYTGIVVPFSKDIILAAIAEHRSFNNPIKIVVKMEPSSRKLVVDLLPNVDPNAVSVDIFHYHVKPFTCIRKVTDFTPLTLHPDIKLIHTKPILSKFVKQIGYPAGVDLNAVMEVDNELFDMKTVIDRFALYKYNPVNMLMFFFTDTGIKMNGMPSNQHTQLTVLYNPAKSTTKQISLDVGMAIARMQLAEQKIFQYKIQYSPYIQVLEAPLNLKIPVGLKLFNVLTKFGCKLKLFHDNFALTTMANIYLKGDILKTYSFRLTSGLGLDKNTKKWMIHLEHMPETSQAFHICIDGQINEPVIPLWDIEELLTSNVAFNFKNDIGFGQQCTTYKISLNGVASVSEVQKTLSRTSHLAKLCEKAVSGSSSLVGRQNDVLPQHVACLMQRDQATTLDHLTLNINFAKLPPNISPYQKTIESYLKLLFLPHIETNLLTWFSEPLTNASIFKAQVEFKAEQNLVTIKIITPAGPVVLKNIRLPDPVHGVIPLIAGKTSMDQIHESLTGDPLNPTCYVTENGHIQTFDQHLYSYNIDDCYHLVASDCSTKFSAAVLARETAGVKYVKIYHGNNQFKLKFPKVFFNGQEIEIPPNDVKAIHTPDAYFSYTIRRTVDDVFIVDTPVFIVEYNGQRIQVKSKQIKITGQMCGLCGDNNKDSRFDLKSPTTCIYKSDLLAALSYRHQTPKCSTLRKEKMDLIATEEAQCAKHMVSSPQPQFQPMIGSRMKHYTIKNIQGQLCISKSPLPSCLSSFIPMSSIEPMVPYTCITHPSNKVVKHYEQKVKSGVILPELKMLETHITIPTKIPQFCNKF